MLLATAPTLFFRWESRRRQDGAWRCFNAVGLLQGVLARVFPIVGCTTVCPDAYFVRGIKIKEIYFSFGSADDVP
jgi:hypothetical protein